MHSVREVAGWKFLLSVKSQEVIGGVIPSDAHWGGMWISLSLPRHRWTMGMDSLSLSRHK